MERTDSIVLAAGCFWCVEAIFSHVKGVTDVIPGYAGGAISNPSYREVCSGRTGHAEVVKIEYVITEVDLAQLFAVFFATHDPTSLNRQGGDVGTQYRSAIFPSSSKQRILAEKALKIATDSGEWEGEIVTTIEALNAFYKAENYHQNYFAENVEAPYCSAVIAPKLRMFKRRFEHLLE